LIRFSVFEVDLTSGEVRKSGQRVKLAGQPFEVLQALLERPGEIVTREELRRRLWPQNTFVDHELAIKKAVNRLRDVLSDSAESPHFIETVPRRGYRFIGNIAASSIQSEPNKPQAADPVVSKPSQSFPRMRLLKGLSVPLALLIVGGLLLLLNVDKMRTRIFARSQPLEIHSIAVLPLQDLSSDPKQEYFSDGMTDELITNLAEFSKLRVISHTSVERYKETKLPLPEIAKQLGVDVVVEGKVLRSGDRVRITAQLIDARSDTHLWAESYERGFQDILALQDELAADIAKKIGGKLNVDDRSRSSSARPVDAATNEAYLKGRYFYGKLSADGFKEALKYYQEAAARDPNYAPAYVGIGASYEGLGIWHELRPRDAAAKSRAALEKALALDSTLGEAHAILGHIDFLWEWDWAAAEGEYKRALELGPPSSMIQIRYAIFLASMGRSSEAIQQMKEAHIVDPVSLLSNDLFGYVYYLSHDFDHAIDQYKKTLALYPDAEAVHFYLARSYELKGMLPEAFAEYQRQELLTGSTEAELTTQRKLFEKSGWNGFWRRKLETAVEDSKHRYIPSIWFAEIYARFGARDKSFESLEKAREDRDDGMSFIKAEPVLAPLHEDLRFQAMLHRMNFPL
jgi:TolB-like protein/DNA-binding winged helix-turn-helix (wHTH) protein/Tfp pilus assembly protein PilF